MAEVKPGIRTTEFWISIGAAIVGPVLAFNLIDEQTVAGVVAAITPVINAFGYTISRGQAKKPASVS